MKFYLSGLYSKLQYIISKGAAFYPLRLTWYITSACNYSCLICFQQENSFFHPCKELPFPEIVSFIDELAELYKLYPVKPDIIISGGEPLLRRDIFDICLYLEKKKFRYKLASNLSVCDGLMIKKLAALKPKALGVSLDADPQTYAENRGDNACFEAVTETLDKYRILNKKVPIKICYTVTKQNIGTMHNMPKLASRWQASLNINHLFFLTPQEKDVYQQWSQFIFGRKINFASSFVTSFDASMAEGIAEDVIKAKKEAKKYGISLKLLPEVPHQDIKAYYAGRARKLYPGTRCRNYYYELRIAPNGEVYPCLQYSYGNLGKNSFKEILFGENARWFRKKMNQSDLSSGCLRCSKKIINKNHASGWF